MLSCPVCLSKSSSLVVEFPELRYVRCTDCSLIYKDQQIERLGVGYEEEYFRFNRAKYLERWNHRVRKCRRQILACLEFVPQAERLLDIGCSAGYVLEAARREGLAPTGLDLSEFAVNLCSERGFSAERGSLMAIPFDDNSFDIVTLKHTLEHVERPMDALREVARVLRPGGVALVIVPDAEYWKLSLMPRRGRSFRPDRRGWQHHTYFSTGNLADACRRASLLPVLEGKTIFRGRLAKGARVIFERARWALLGAWVWTCRVTRTRREIQVIARKQG